MKNLWFKSIFAALLIALPHANAFAQQSQRSRSDHKEFATAGNVKVSIETSFGKVQCVTWDKNQVTVDVRVNASASTDRDAQKILDAISTQISGNSSEIIIRTAIGNTGNSRNKSFNVDYTINLPRTANLDISQRFGDLFLDDCTGKVKINVEYGNLTLGSLTDPASDITLKFSKGTINQLGDCKLKLEYSTLKTRRSANLKVNSRFSTYESGEVTILDTDSEYDTFMVDRVTEFSGSGKFSSFKVEELLRKADLAIDYGDLEIKSVADNFILVNLISSFNNIRIRIPSSASYKLNADMSFGECRYPANASVSVTEKSFTNKLYSGIVGSNRSSTARVNIKGKNSDVKLY